MSSFLEKHFLPVAGRIGSNRYLQSVRDGMIFTVPFIMVGSVFLILVNLPIPGYDAAVTSLLGANWKAVALLPVRATFDSMALIATAAIAYSLAKKYQIDGLAAGMTALAAFILSTPLEITAQGGVVVQKALSLNYTSSKGLFVGMLCAIITAEIFKFAVAKKITISMPDSVPESVSRSFSALFPAGMVIIFFWLVRLLLSTTPFDNLHVLLETLIGRPLSILSGSLIGLIVGLICQQLLWAVGLHGSSLLLAGLRPPLLQLLDENRIAYEAGQHLPNIINQAFYDLFIQGIGGSGATLGLTLILFFFIRSKQLKEVGKLALIPSFFNINEPLSFGIPIIMNPMMLVPWIITPITTLLISYYAMDFGLVARTTGVLVPWTTPPLISGFLATGHISGSILQFVNIIVTGLIYYPFIMMWDKQKLAEEIVERK